MSNFEDNAKSTYDTARELVDDLARLGKSWLKLGLAVGESSIQASARTLDDAARTLRKIADRVGHG